MIILQVGNQFPSCFESFCDIMAPVDISINGSKKIISFLCPVTLKLLIFYAVFFVTVMAISHLQYAM